MFFVTQFSCLCHIFFALEDDDNDDDENEDDADYEEVVVSRNLLSFMEEDTFEARPTKRRSWDDEYVLKRQFSALIPAFDPRPGRTNVNQTTGRYIYRKIVFYPSFVKDAILFMFIVLCRLGNSCTRSRRNQYRYRERILATTEITIGIERT